MAGLDYWSIETELKAILAADPILNNVGIILEEEFEPAIDILPVIGIFLDAMRSPEEQAIAAGKKHRKNIVYSLWAFDYDIENNANATKKILSLMDKLEQVLMANRTINGKVDKAWFEEGEVVSTKNKDTGTIISGIEIKLVVDVTTSIL